MENNLIVKPEMTQDQIALLKRTICNGSTDDEFKLFLHVANKSGLDPFARQIHAVKRGGKMTIQVGIDGFRLIAFRTNTYAGRDEAIFEYEDNKKIPVKCKITVYKLIGGQRCPFTASARWDEYCPGSNPMWTKMPETMLEKCAEAKALRMAFPAELSGLYTNEEMQQADAPKNTQELQPQSVDTPSYQAKTEELITLPPIGAAANNFFTEEELNETKYPVEDLTPVGTRCSNCNTIMKPSKSGQYLYCPNFKDDKNGKHPTVRL